MKDSQFHPDSFPDRRDMRVGLFFRFLENKSPELIRNEDLEIFNKDYIISRKFSASFQSGVIH